MYDTFYGLNGRPFQLTPDPHFYFESLTHRKALSYLGYGLAQGEGFIVITGDVGAGKTTLVSHLMATIDKARLTAANIVTTKLDSEDIVRVAANHFDINTDHMDKAQLLSAFEEFLHAEARAGRRCLLIVDESQNLPAGALEELRMLSNFQLGGQALLQIFLLGQPEFRDMLQNSNQLEQLRQRVIAHHHLEPMDAEEIEPYVTHRLSKCGWSGRPKITSSVFRLLYSETNGVPRKINALMSRILLMGSIEHAEMIDQPMVERVLADLKGEDVEIAAPPTAPAAPKNPLWEKPRKAQDASADAVAKNPAPQSAPAPVPAAAPAPAPAQEHEVVNFRAPEASPTAPPKTAEVQAAPEPKSAAPTAAPAVSEVADSEVADKAMIQRLDALAKQLSLMEARMNDQEANLHRVLTLLVEWVENDVRSKESYVNAGRAA
ncbi:XrtA/PEP-CTERM system-associated ATPase [uncultured Parasphingorhabdus sp.]|uniref:XrtA/PEP-CTERM system-associated ATPase n=1 Tax=uncultured Parasphingorhabdus sp. TaxID=2709694 RepID=UPI002AA63507|nr:XrtA/PEP-CTERM system-associated ATPase [uncultured Parasphingorhabdus sp.]